MEVNPNHPIMKELKNKFTSNESDRTVKDLVWLIYETAALTSGFTLKDPVIFASRIHKLIKLGLSIDDEEDIEEIKESKDEDLPSLDNIDQST